MQFDTSKSNGPGHFDMGGAKVQGLNDARSDNGDMAFFADEDLLHGFGDHDAVSKKQE